MALRCARMLQKHIKYTGNTNCKCVSLSSSSVQLYEHKLKKYKTEDSLIFKEDPDTFGTLTKILINNNKHLPEDEGDLKEQRYLEEKPLSHQKFTIHQYSELIKQYLKHKRLQEAINVLEIRMLKEDRVKPENYIYNILIGACADVGYTKKAFKLFNDMKRRSLKPTGDTYTCLFEACTNSPWLSDGLKRAHKLRELMIENGVEPNLTNYNAMIKAFGRCGDLPMAFKIVDEMISKKIKIRVHTLNHLLHACISDKNHGLRHALIVWRKMLILREKPNIYSFNLMLKCVKDCNMGSKEDIEELVAVVSEQKATKSKNLKIESSKLSLQEKDCDTKLLRDQTVKNIPPSVNESCSLVSLPGHDISNTLAVIETTHNIHLQLVTDNQLPKRSKENRVIPNMLSKVLQMSQVHCLQAVDTPQEKFAVVGGQEDFLKEMQVYSVKPDIKTFTQMLSLLDDTTEAELKLLDTMKELDINADIDFYNMLIKKRCFRQDYDAAMEVKELINKANLILKKKYPLKKKQRLKPNIMTYGVLAMTCKTQESAEKLLNEMKEKQLKVNIEILGSMLKHGTFSCKFGYVLYIMSFVKSENIQVSKLFLKLLEDFNEKCKILIKPDDKGKLHCTEIFKKTYKIFNITYNKWIQEVNIDDTLNPEHPWKQFSETYPETVQRSNIQIKQPTKFYKRNRKFVHYGSKIKIN